VARVRGWTLCFERRGLVCTPGGSEGEMLGRFSETGRGWTSKLNGEGEVA
jgi:hypothetical protein